MRLIDADEAKKFYKENLILPEKSHEIIVRTMIDAVPTAYDLDKVFSELKTDSSVKLYGSQNSDNYLIPVNKAIEIVKHGGVDDDVCEYKIKDKVIYASCNNKQIASAFCWFNECGDYKYCPYCGKKINVM